MTLDNKQATGVVRQAVTDVGIYSGVISLFGGVLFWLQRIGHGQGLGSLGEFMFILPFMAWVPIIGSAVAVTAVQYYQSDDDREDTGGQGP